MNDQELMESKKKRINNQGGNDIKIEDNLDNDEFDQLKESIEMKH